MSDGLPYDRGGAQLRAFRHMLHFRSSEDDDALLLVWDRSLDSSNQDEFPANVHPIKLWLSNLSSSSKFFKKTKLLLHLSELLIRLSHKLLTLRHQFDILHVINAASLFSLMTIPIGRALGKQVIVETVLLGADDPLTLVRRKGDREKQWIPHVPLKYRLFNQANMYITKSRALSDAYRRAGLPGSKLFEIPSGVDPTAFRPVTVSERLRLRQKLQLPSERTILLFIGGIKRRKGVHHLIRAFRKVHECHGQAYLLVIGPVADRDINYLRKIEQYIDKHALQSNVRLIPQRVTRVDEYLQAADIFVLPTAREGLSVAILEAMASGLAIVASDIPEIAKSQITQGCEGLLVPPGHIDDLARALSQLIADAQLRDRLGQAARCRVEREFTDVQMYERYRELYASVVQGKHV